MMRAILVAVALFATACGLPDHQNPFDPGTPPALQARATLTGSVTLEAIGSVAPALSGIDVSVPGVGSVTTDATGAWSLPNVPPGTWSVQLRRDRYLDASLTGVVVTLDDGEKTVATAPVALRLARGEVAGTVTLPLASSSAGVVVTATGPDGASATGLTDAGGAFTLTGLPVGTYALAARKDPEWQPGAATGVVVTAGARASVAPLELSPVATASITGTAVLEVLGAVAGTTAGLVGADFRGAAVSRTVTTGVAGAFSFTGLVAGSYQLTLSRAEYDTTAPVGLSVSASQAVAVGAMAVAASRGGASGLVTATGAASQAGTVVTVSGGPDSATTVTDSAGLWVVAGLRVGTGYAATFQRAAYTSSTSAGFDVTPGAVTVVTPATLGLATTGSLSGTVAVERGSAAGVSVTLSGTDVNGSAVTGATTTGAGGAWSIGGLAQGTYALAFSKAGYDTASRSGLAVTAGAAAAPDVTLSVSLGTVAGTVSLSAGGITGFGVGTDFSGVVVTLAR